MVGAKILRSFALSFDNKCMAAATDVLAVVVKLNELKLKGEREAVMLRWFICV